MAAPTPHTPQRQQQAGDVLRILEEFSQGAQHPFDRILAGRALAEAGRAIPGDGVRTWARRLVEVGESMDLRVQSLECTLPDALAFVRQGMPVATAVEQPDGSLQWMVVCEVRGRRVRLGAFEAGASDTWVSQRALRRRLGGVAPADRRPWLVGQPALACELASGPSHNHGDAHSVSPLSRLWGLMLPERRDLWVIVVFSIIDGVLLLATPIAVEALVRHKPTACGRATLKGSADPACLFRGRLAE